MSSAWISGILLIRRLGSMGIRLYARDPKEFLSAKAGSANDALRAPEAS